MSEAENLLKKVRKLESNRVCPNCGTAAPTGLGFGNVCVKFKTFVCDLCKTSHQAISHRVKSVSMSSWTMAEVQELLHERGGGNLMCTMTWLANAPAIGGSYPGGTRPKAGDKIDVFKKFVIDCYEYAMFKGEASASSINNNPSTPVAAAPSPSTRSSSASPAAATIAAPVPVHVNLFDFDNNAPPASASAPPVLGSDFSDPFAAPHFPSPAAATPPSSVFDFNTAFGAPASTPPADPFATFNSAPVTPLASSPAPTGVPQSRSACNFDDIFGSAPLQPSSQHVRPNPMMSNNSAGPSPMMCNNSAGPSPMMNNNAGFAISGMNAMMTAPSPPPMAAYNPAYQQRQMPMGQPVGHAYRQQSPAYGQQSPAFGNNVSNAFDFIGASIQSELNHNNNNATASSGRPPMASMNSLMQQQQQQQQYNSFNNNNNSGFPSNW